MISRQTFEVHKVSVCLRGCIQIKDGLVSSPLCGFHGPLDLFTTLFAVHTEKKGKKRVWTIFSLYSLRI